jgi:hypothetical protein
MRDLRSTKTKNTRPTSVSQLDFRKSAVPPGVVGKVEMEILVDFSGKIFGKPLPLGRGKLLSPFLFTGGFCD